MSLPARSRRRGDEQKSCDSWETHVSAKLAGRWAYALVLSIVVLVTAFLGLGVRTFASAVISHSIFLAAFGIVLLVLPVYFALRRPRVPGALHRLPALGASASLAKLNRKSHPADMS
jgi:uncharacterized membrane protein YfcA